MNCNNIRKKHILIGIAIVMLMSLTIGLSVGLTMRVPEATWNPDSPRTSVLILNTYSSYIAVITDDNGKEEYAGVDFRFTFGRNTDVYKSCSVTWRGQLFIFGGRHETKQISKVNGCKLE